MFVIYQNLNHNAGQKGSSAEVSGVDSVREIPVMNPKDLSGQEQPLVAVFNTFRQHLLERDTSNRAMLRSNVRQVRALTDTVTAQSNMLQMIWSEHCDMKKGLEEEREMTRKAILYSLEQSGSFSVPEKHPSVHEELLWAFGSKSKVSEQGTSTSTAKRQQTSGALKRRLDFDVAAEADDADQTAEGNDQPAQQVKSSGIKYGYIGSADFPQRLRVSFRPPPGMQFLITEVAAGAYVFSKSKDKTELLFQSDHFKADRGTFWTLCPKKIVSAEILDAVATMLQDESHSSYWWLPITFQEIALNPKGYCKQSLDYIVRRYMGYRLATSLMTSKANRKRDELCLKTLNYFEGRDRARELELGMSSDSDSSNDENAIPSDSNSVEI
ncbi:hypothetical protein PIB30_085088 [Stylosanthes scabra]|uniref:Uncharacterized protein n=1 Tax=Stylosanthes scabra TaxID=79078 RepID=A0ABU6XS50_9FABA|nr:hypothetical protein [Stylosanthes scabra]